MFLGYIKFYKYKLLLKFCGYIYNVRDDFYSKY